jgi:magnesium transporter
VATMIEKRSPPIGARPGTLAIAEGSPAPRIYLFDYGPDGVVERPIERVEELEPFARTETVTWINVQGMGDEATLRRIAELFEIHPLALEDAVNVPQRAKAELYDEHQLVIARAPLLEDGRIEVPQVCFLIGRHYLVTFQDRYFGFFDPIRERIRAGIGPIRKSGPDYLAYTLIDVLVDRYYPVVEDLARELDELEDEALDDPQPEDLARLHHIRRDLATLRRVAWPQRETIQDMVRSPSTFLGDDARVYLRDTDDHMAQIIGRLDFCREVAVGLMDLHLSTMGHRQNEIMKVLTLMASIFIPLTFIAGIYGMNFENMPELQSRIGYFVVLGVMVLLAIVLVGYFRQRGWLGRPRRRRVPRQRRE